MLDETSFYNKIKERNQLQYDRSFVPILTSDAIAKGEIANGTLVKLRLIIRDILNPEFILDESSSPTDPMTNEMDRLPLHCVAISGETMWSKSSYLESSCVKKPIVSFQPEDTKPLTKRTRDCVPSDETFDETRSPIMNKRHIDENQKLQNKDQTWKKLSESSFLVYIYDEERPYKIHQVYEFLGYLDLDSSLDHVDSTTEEGFPSIRIHCIDAKSMSNINFVFPQEEPVVKSSSLYLQRITTSIPVLRKKLIDYIASSLGGDVLIAEYLLLVLVSKVYSRDQMLAIGSLSINLISHQAKELFSSLFATFSSLVPICNPLNFHVEGLCSQTYCAYKDYSTDQLCTGVLETPDSSLLLVNESSMGPGKLNDVALRNLKAMNQLISTQTVPLDFQYYSLDFPTKVHVIVVSQSKSLLETHLQVNVHAYDEQELQSSKTNPLVDNKIMEEFRIYLSVVQDLNYSVNEEQIKWIETYFINKRKEDPTTTAEDFHLWLNLTRLISLSYCEETFDEKKWNYMEKLEKARKERKV